MDNNAECGNYVEGGPERRGMLAFTSMEYRIHRTTAFIYLDQLVTWSLQQSRLENGALN